MGSWMHGATVGSDFILAFLARYPSSQSVRAATMKTMAAVIGDHFQFHSNKISNTGTRIRRRKVRMLGRFMMFSGSPFPLPDCLRAACTPAAA